MQSGKQPRVVIVGAGFGGLAAAIELRRHGFDDLQILEKAPALGGTWWYNRYPACSCDVPSQLYSFSFAQRRVWSRVCSRREEILSYLNEVARERGVEQLIQAGTEVSECVWDEYSKRWTVRSTDGRSWEADAVIVATGQLHRPSIPHIEGAERFAGERFHSAYWNQRLDLRGKRVAVIGTGASAIQLIPDVARKAERLVVFQRTPNWFLPRRNRPYRPWLKALFRVPGVAAVVRGFIYLYTDSLTRMIRHPRTLGRIGRAYSAAFMRRQLKDPRLRARVWPDYTFGCKRILFSSYYLPALQRPNVELVTEAISHLTENELVTADGARHELDCLIYATGFRSADFMLPMEVRGRGGRSLAEAWTGAPHAHLGVTVPGFPSLFLIYGPNTNTSGGSIIFFEEAQSAYIRQALELVRRLGAAAVEVRAEVEQEFNHALQGRFEGTAWVDCQSWYRNSGDGRVFANWPDSMRAYRRRLARLDPLDYQLLDRPPQTPPHRPDADLPTYTQAHD